MAMRWRLGRCALYLGILLAGMLSGPRPLAGQPADARPAIKVLASFERRRMDLERGPWRSNTGGGGVTREHATDGERSLWTTFPRAAAVLWSTTGALAEDWSGYEKLKLDVYLDGSPLILTIQVTDQDGVRYTVPYYYVRPGTNTVEVNLVGAARVVDIGHIASFSLRAARSPEGSNKAYLDNLRLTRGTPDTIPPELATMAEIPSIVGNLVSNPGFEYGLEGWQFWGLFDGGKYQATSASPSEAHTGASCAAIRAVGLSPARGGLATDRIWVPRGGRYGVTVFVKGKGGAVFRLGLANARFWGGAADVQVTLDWQELTYEIAVDDDRKPVRLWLYNVGSGVLHIDDVALVPEKVEEEEVSDEEAPKGQAEVSLSGEFMYVNGKPFYAKGVVGCQEPEKHLTGTAFNLAVAPVVMGSPRPFLNRCHKAGIMGVANLSGSIRTHAPKAATTIAHDLQEHPAVIGWLLGDEPDGEAHPASPPEVRLARQSLQNAVGSDLPMLLRLQSRYQSSVYQYQGLSDIVIVSTEAVGGARPFDLRGITRPIDRAKALLRGKVPVWVVLDLGDEGSLEPEPTELSVMTYLAVTHGANGVLWEPFFYAKEHPAVWQAVLDITEELRQLTPALVSPTVHVITATNKTTMHGAARQHQDQLYLILVNASHEPQPGTTFTLTGVPKSAPVEVLFEDRTLTLEQGVLTDDFEPYQRHVYRLTVPEEVPTSGSE